MLQTLKKILAPIDFSDFSMDSLRGASELATELGAELHIVHIVAPHFALLAYWPVASVWPAAAPQLHGVSRRYDKAIHTQRNRMVSWTP